jgi:hypothetical protein
MGGVAGISGQPGGEPMLPAFAMTDEITGLVGAFATMVALRSEKGQVVDVSLLESIFHIMGPLISVWKTRGEMQERMGSGIPYTVPRGVYRCSDDKYIGISARSDSVAGRVVKLLGFEGDERFATFNLRVENRIALDEAMRNWCSQRTQEQALQEMTDAETAADGALGAQSNAGSWAWYSAGTSLHVPGNVIAYWSDARLKQNVEDLDGYEARIMGLRPVSFEWNEKGRKRTNKAEGHREIGFIAQEVQTVCPQFVAENETPSDDDSTVYLTVQKDQMIADLVAMVQELNKRVTDLEAMLK